MGAVPDTEVPRLENHRHCGLTTPLHEGHRARSGPERDLDDVLPDLLDGRFLVVELDCEPDRPIVQTGDEKEKARQCRAAEAVDLPRKGPSHGILGPRRIGHQVRLSVIDDDLALEHGLHQLEGTRILGAGRGRSTS